MAFVFGGFCLSDQLPDLFERNILLLYEHGYHGGIGLVEVFPYHVLDGVLAELLAGDDSEVAVGVPELLMTQETFLFESADNGGDGVVMWLGFRKFVDDLLHIGRTFLPEELHEFFFAVGEMFHAKIF